MSAAAFFDNPPVRPEFIPYLVDHAKLMTSENAVELLCAWQAKPTPDTKPVIIHVHATDPRILSTYDVRSFLQDITIFPAHNWLDSVETHMEDWPARLAKVPCSQGVFVELPTEIHPQIATFANTGLKAFALLLIALQKPVEAVPVAMEFD